MGITVHTLNSCLNAQLDEVPTHLGVKDEAPVSGG